MRDKLIIEHIKNNNVGVFEAIFKEYFKPLAVFANQYVSDMDLAQDITQEIFIKKYEKKNDLVIHTSLKSFLYVAAKNKCLDYLRSAKVRKKHKDHIIK
ncbi:sigma factor [Aquimarina sp. 2201CG1-2-11]|uniref:sigma factor n=1 Tax=Aquimarina discodermiae TaxID=3231043 RepID=UPI0034628951